MLDRAKQLFLPLKPFIFPAENVNVAVLKLPNSFLHDGILTNRRCRTQASALDFTLPSPFPKLTIVGGGGEGGFATFHEFA